MKNKTINTFLRYPGGKSKNSIRQKIYSKFPKYYEEYREAFVGGGGVFFGLDRSSVKRLWINDANAALIEVYNALRDRPEEFIESCRKIDPPLEEEPTVNSRENSRGGKQYNKRLKEVFDFFKYNNDCDQALRYFFLNRTVWGGRVNYDPDKESRLYFSNPQGWNIVKTDKLHIASEYLKNVRITALDFEHVLLEDGENVVIYADPPYIKDTVLSEQSKLYQFGFSMQDHIRFRDCVLKSKHKIIISYDDIDIIRLLYSCKPFNIYEEEWVYCGTSSPKNSESQRKKKTGKELIITNFL